MQKEEELKITVAKNLESERNRLHITHVELANKLGINRTTLYLYESGKRMLPIEILYRLWREYKIEPNKLLGIEKC